MIRWTGLAIRGNPKPQPQENQGRCRANAAHIRQSRQDFGLGFTVKSSKRFKLFPLRSEADGADRGALDPDS